MLTEEYKRALIRKIEIGECEIDFNAIGIKNGKRIVSATITIHEGPESCRDHHLPKIYRITKMPGMYCDGCIDESNARRNCYAA